MRNLIEIVDGLPRQVQYTLPQPINISICEGEQTAIVGANGSGKSVFVGAMIGAIPLKGEGVKYDFAGRPSTKASDNITHLAFRDSYGATDKSYYHQQRWNSCDRESQPLVGDIIARCGRNEYEEKIYQLFDIESILSKELILLSSGELRKFQLVKALLANPTILMLEDPYIGLDVKARGQLTSSLEELVKSKMVQVVLVLSKPNDIPNFITHVIAIKDGVAQDKIAYLSPGTDIGINRSQKLSLTNRQSILDLPTTDSHHSSKSIVSLNNISIKYGKHTILKDLTWHLRQGEQWALSGENGAGKSTLLSLICADIPQGYACDLELFGRKRGSGESIWDIKKHIGYVSPEMHRSYRESAPCIEIVASGLHDTVGLYKRMKEEQRDVCLFWMDMFGITKLQDRDFMRISSGEQRLVLLARAFVKDPELLILDEPLHGLDQENRCLALDIIETFCSRPNKSLIFVSHYKEELPQSITHSLHLSKV